MSESKAKAMRRAARTAPPIKRTLWRVVVDTFVNAFWEVKR
jgi:hypothetical protein